MLSSSLSLYCKSRIRSCRCVVSTCDEDGILGAGLLSLVARGCYVMAVLALPRDKLQSVSETNKRICYHITRTYWCATVSYAEVAASLLCPWLGDAWTRPRAGGGMALCMRSAPPARPKRVRLESCNARSRLTEAQDNPDGTHTVVAFVGTVHV